MLGPVAPDPLQAGSRSGSPSELRAALQGRLPGPALRDSLRQFRHQGDSSAVAAEIHPARPRDDEAGTGQAPVGPDSESRA
jgi:hypothetical protein